MIERIKIKESYIFYRQDNDRVLTEEEQLAIPKIARYNEDRKVYLKIVMGLFKFIMVKVFQGYEVKLGGRLGRVAVRGRATNPKIFDYNGKNVISGIPVDWGETNKLWATNPEAKENKVRIFHFNDHSNGIRYRIYWSLRNMIFPNKSYYSLCFTRRNERHLAKLVKEGKEFDVLPPKAPYNEQFKIDRLKRQEENISEY